MMEIIDHPITPIELDMVAQDLEWLTPAPVFFGAAILPLYLNVAAIRNDPQIRPTKDVDVILLLSEDQPAPQAQHTMEEALRRHGWVLDMRQSRKSRNIHAYLSPSGVPVDIVMDRLYDRADWPIQASQFAQQHRLSSGRLLRIPSPGFFLACKIAASTNPSRWEGSYYCHDLEDIVTLLMGCSHVATSVRAGPEGLVWFIAHWTEQLLRGELSASFEVMCSSIPSGTSEQALIQHLQTLKNIKVTS